MSSSPPPSDVSQNPLSSGPSESKEPVPANANNPSPVKPSPFRPKGKVSMPAASGKPTPSLLASTKADSDSDTS